ncbi:MAG: large subunit ribosomal protein [Actinomycetota bacterium]|nr:large subunit ribosomal protein [Actinomycetota bacterium]
MSEVKITAAKRTEFGKGAARRLRRAHQVPAVIYGHGTDPVHVALPGHATMLALKQHNALIDLDVEGTPLLVLPKAVQRDAVKGFIEHVDLLLVRRGEKVTVDVSLHITGTPASGTLVTSELSSLTVEVEATHIPSQIEVSVEGAAAGTRIHAGDIVLPEGAVLITDADAAAVNISSASEDSSADAAAEVAGSADAEA